MNESPRKAVLTHYFRVFETPPSFVVPVFQAVVDSSFDHANPALVQQVTEDHTIASFATFDTEDKGAHLVRALDGLEKQVGDPCLVAYELRHNHIIKDTTAELRNRLTAELHDPVFFDNLFSRWELAEFCGDEDVLLEIAKWSRRQESRTHRYFYNSLRRRLIYAALKRRVDENALKQITFDLIERDGRTAFKEPVPVDTELSRLISAEIRNFDNNVINYKQRPPAMLGFPKTYSRIFGRTKEREIITRAWQSSETKVFAFIGLGGIGKSTLVLDWLSSFKPAEPVSIFLFSFYEHVQTERQVDTDTFLNEVAKYFGIEIDTKAAPFAKGKIVAQQIMKKRALIVLDGLEPLQEAATGRLRSEEYGEQRVSEGGFTDNGALGFIETLALARDFEGLCILTSRITISDLSYLKRHNRYVEYTLNGLEDDEGAALLADLGVQGTFEQRRQISRDLNGHALALLLRAQFGLDTS